MKTDVGAIRGEVETDDGTFEFRRLDESHGFECEWVVDHQEILFVGYEVVSALAVL